MAKLESERERSRYLGLSKGMEILDGEMDEVQGRAKARSLKIRHFGFWEGSGPREERLMTALYNNNILLQ